MSATTLDATPTPVRVLLCAEAKARGFRNALALRRWCQRHGVPVLRDGKMLWVKRSDVDRALEALAGGHHRDVGTNEQDAVAETVATITGGR